MRGLLQILINIILFPSICLGASFENGVLITSGTACDNDIQAVGNIEQRFSTGISDGVMGLSDDLSCEGSSSPFDGHDTLQNDLWAYYTMEDASGDDVLEAHDAAPNGSFNIIAGKNGNGLDFTAAYGEYLNVGYAGASLTEWTVSVWVYADSSVHGWDGNESFLSDQNQSNLLLSSYNSPADIRLYTYTTSLQQHSDSLVNDSWIHIVVSHDQTAGEYYVVQNGDWAGRLSGSGTTTHDLQLKYIGMSRFLGNNFENYMDEFAVWSRVLTQSEVEDLYNAGDGLFYY